MDECKPLLYTMFLMSGVPSYSTSHTMVQWRKLNSKAKFERGSSTF